MKVAQEAHEVAYNARLKRIWKLAREDHREEKKEKEEKEKEEMAKIKKPLVSVRSGNKKDVSSSSLQSLKYTTRVRRAASLSAQTQNQIRVVMSVDELRVTLFTNTYRDLFCKILSEEATKLFGSFETILECISGDDGSAMAVQCVLRPHNDGHDEEDPIRLQELCDEEDGDDDEVKSVIRKLINHFKFRYSKTIGLTITPRVEQILLEPRESYRSRVASLDSEIAPPYTFFSLDDDNDDNGDDDDENDNSDENKEKDEEFLLPPGHIRKVSTRTLNLVNNVEHRESLIADLHKIDDSLPPGMLRRVSVTTMDVVQHMGKKSSLLAPKDLDDEDEDETPPPPTPLAVRETRETLMALVRKKTLHSTHAGHDGPGSGETPTEDDINGNFGPIRVLAKENKLDPKIRFPFKEPETESSSVLAYDGHWLANEGRKWVLAAPAMIYGMRHAYVDVEAQEHRFLFHLSLSRC